MQDMHLILAVGAAGLYVFGYYRMPFVYGGLFLQVIYLISRGIKLDRMPLVGPHDTLFFLSASTVLFAVPIAWKMKERQRFMNPAVGISLVFMALAFFFRAHDAPLPPVLRTFWFETHVAFSFFSYGLFGLGAILGVLSLVYKERETEGLQYKAILVGYFLFSAAMVFGGIWAYLAWGTYWLWTPKELWTVILWLFYSLFLHARLRSWWAGRPSAALGIIGFVIVMFTYLGVSLLMKSSHTF